MKRLVSIVLALVMFAAVIPGFAADSETSFSDVAADDYYAAAANALVKAEILTGYEDGTFRPNGNITRAEMAAIICRVIGREEVGSVKTATDFDDVEEDSWASGYIKVASDAGIINGDGNGSFRPDDDVTYEEAIKMVVCALGLADDIEANPSDWSKPYIDVAKANGITTSLKGSKGTASTRADVAVMTYNGICATIAAPVASVAAGSYTSTQSVTLTSATSGAVIYYTTDGSEPTTASTKYTKAISIAKTTTLKAVAVLDDVFAGSVTSVAYTVTVSSSGGGGGGGGSSSSTKYTVTFDLNYGESEAETEEVTEESSEEPTEEATEEPSEEPTEEVTEEDADEAEEVTAPAAQTVKKNSKVTEPDEPEREGYVFTGWYTEAECTTLYDFSAKVTKSFTLYAGWSEIGDIYYQIVFDANCDDAENIPSNQTVGYGVVLAEPTQTPTREGYDFSGWFTNQECTSEFDFSTVITESIVLYAGWTSVSGGEISLDDPEPDVEIYSFTADTYDILVGDEQSVTFTSEIFANIELSSEDVSVVNENDEIIGYMNDDGVDGDEVADDGIYTLVAVCSSDVVTMIEYYAIVSDISSDGIWLNFYRVYNDEDFELRDSVVEMLNDAIAPYLTEDNTVMEDDVDSATAALTEVLDQLIASGEVGSYNVSVGSISIELSTGYPITYEIAIDGTESGGSGGFIATYQPYYGLRGSMNSLYNDATDGSAETIEENVSGYSFTGNFDLNDVTLDNLKNLSDYSVIIWGGHGGYDDTVNGKGAYVATGELHSNATSTEYSADISAKRVVDYVTAENRGTYAVTGGFFDKYLGDMSGALVYIASCHSGQDMIDGITHRYQLVQSFINKGATAVFGNSGTIKSVYNYKMERDVFERMCELSDDDVYYSASEALTYAKSKNGNTDSQGTYPIIFPRGDSKALNYRFENADPGYMAGSVKSAETSENIENALVRVYEDSTLITSVRTDSNGYYNIELPVGEYIVKVSAGSYKSAKIGVSVESNVTTYNETFLMVDAGLEWGYAHGTITSALTGIGVEDVDVTLRSSWNNQDGAIVYSTTTNANGYYEIEYTPGFYTMEYSKDDYITGYKNIVIGVIDISAQNATISPILSDDGEYRIVLTWSDLPYDLDSHLTGPSISGSRFHLYYPQADTNGGSNEPEYYTLDLDNTDIVSRPDVPETVTILQQLDGVYRYSVHDFTNSGNASSTAMANSNATVNVYKGDVLVATFHVPTNVSGTIWTVFELSGDTITPVNAIGNGYAYDASLFSMEDEDFEVEDFKIETDEDFDAEGFIFETDEDIIMSDLIEK